MVQALVDTINEQRLRWEPRGNGFVYRGNLACIVPASDDERFDVQSIYDAVFTIRKPGRVMALPDLRDSPRRIDAECFDLETNAHFCVEIVDRIIRFYIRQDGTGETATRLYELICKQPGCDGARLFLGNQQIWPEVGTD